MPVSNMIEIFDMHEMASRNLQKGRVFLGKSNPLETFLDDQLISITDFLATSRYIRIQHNHL
jgi:hypothetical protein